MAYFVVRVELHDESDYDELNAAMRKRGFSRNIQGKNGRFYRLPTGQYRLESASFDRAKVLLKAKAAVAKTGERASITVTEGRTVWSRLDEVRTIGRIRRR
ncbi:MAG TPA: hypothetical protein VG125_25860 [Pirellulales bacterium]|jgi:hypothetical protein|nr:hypothetical protein [Pirellulales bacterium]